MKCEVWWAKWKLFHIEIYGFWTISNCIKASGKRASLEPLKVNMHNHVQLQLFLMRHFSLCQIKLTANIWTNHLAWVHFFYPTMFQTSFSQIYKMRMFKAHCKNSNWNANILNPNITISNHANFDLLATLWVQREFVGASCNYSAQVAKI